jgi:7,8-dihydropterin-6-yl-methyl-4-(beta-D-ribofuranosyl)aminobenzene 5'-phosphate synthase
MESGRNPGKLLPVAAGLATSAATAGGALAARFYLGRLKADEAWRKRTYSPPGDIGAVESLTLLPLVDWYTAGGDLKSEAGVSYLVRADDTTILFDTGENLHRENPSPLMHNMERLGVDAADVDAVVISHLHIDHVGGAKNVRHRTFGITNGPDRLGRVPAYVPVGMSHPRANCILSEEPKRVAPGVVTTGTIPRQLFFLGWTPEQALAVNVSHRGIVLVVGCGHQTLERIIDRAEELFDEPIYGVVGGLHYPVTDSRMKIAKIPVQRLLGTGKPPWRPITRGEVEAAASYLDQRNPKLVSLSAHDSCDWSIGYMRDRFGDRYRDLVVGEKIEVNPAQQ